MHHISYYMKRKFRVEKMDRISRMQMIVTGFAFILFLVILICFLVQNPLDENSYIIIACIVICSLVWIYSFYRNYHRDKYH